MFSYEKCVMGFPMTKCLKALMEGLLAAVRSSVRNRAEVAAYPAFDNSSAAPLFYALLLT